MKNQEKSERKVIREIYVYATPLRTIGEAWEEAKEYAIRIQKYTRGFAIFKTPGDRDHPNQFKQPSGHRVYPTIEEMEKDFSLKRAEVELTFKG